MSINEEQKNIRELAGKIATQEILPRARGVDTDQAFPREGLQALARAGFLGMVVPEALGGEGKDTLSFVLVAEAAARACASTALVFVTHETVARAVAAAGSDQQKSRFLPELISGNKICALAATEANSGSNSLAVSTKAARDGDKFVVNGSKMFITGAKEASLYLVLLRTDQSKGPMDLSALIIEKGNEGFTFGKTEENMGLRGASDGELIFRNCPVPVANLLGAENGYVAISSRFAGLAMLGMAGISLGIAQAALDAAIQHAKTRTIAGQAIGQFQGIQYLIAEMATSLAAARELTYHAAIQQDGPQPGSPLPMYMAKLFATEMAIEVTNQALQVHGGTGYSRELPVERYCRDARGLTLHFTPSEMLKGMLGKMFMGMPPF